jgi:V-type H+-transporting ATPase subunit a
MYKEVNPALFTIVTFPFLFGVMFGDIMHGFMLFVFSTILCFSERRPGTVMEKIGQYRYLLLLMGLFSTFCGFIYNDFTSIPLTIWGRSCYNMRPTDHSIPNLARKDCIYPIGLDPVWYMSINELNFMNSLKMKTSVILGVA